MPKHCKGRWLLSAKSTGGEEASAQQVSQASDGGRHEPAHNFALISVPGDYAAAEAMKALRLGMDVMLFSDNVLRSANWR